MHQPTAGEYLVEGKPVRFKSPRDALDLGIATVYQDLALVPLLSVARNFFMGREPQKKLFGLFSVMDLETARRTARDKLPKWASTCAIRISRSARCPAASGNVWRSRARFISARAC